MAYQLDVTTVREAARGHWDAIFCALAPTFKVAMQRPGKHVPCPCTEERTVSDFSKTIGKRARACAIPVEISETVLLRFSGCMTGALRTRCLGWRVCWGFNLGTGKKCSNAGRSIAYTAGTFSSWGCLKSDARKRLKVLSSRLTTRSPNRFESSEHER